MLNATPSVLLLGDSRTTLTFIRSLAAVGYPIITGRSEHTSYGQYSRYTSEVWQHPPAEGGGKIFMTAVQQFLLSRPDISLIFPLGDRQATHLAMYSHMIPESAKVVMAEPSVVLSCMDKNEMCEIASELGIPQCRFATASSMKELKDQANDLGYPCVVKPEDPTVRIFGEKAVICRSAEELEKHFPSWPADIKGLLLQQYARGFRHNIQLLASEGELLCSLETRTLRTDRWNDTGYTVESVSVKRHPLMHDYCKKLLKRLNYSGLGCAQFLLDDETNTMIFLEMNPRLGAAFGVANHCGIDFPAMAADLFLNDRWDRSFGDIDYPEGRRIVWTHGDLEGLIHERERITRKEAVAWLGRTVKSFIHAHVHASWSWKDPLPTLVACTRLTCRVLLKLLRAPLGLMGKFHRNAAAP